MNFPQIKIEENEREERLLKRFAESIRSRAHNVVLAESRGKKLSEKVYDKYMITPKQFINKSFLKLSLASLYRRYRQIEMKTLVDVLYILGNSDTIEEARILVSDRLKRVGTAHRESQTEGDK